MSEVSTYLPEQLLLTLVGITLMFGTAQQNATLDRLARFAVRSARGHPALLPFIFFLLTFIFSAIGPGNIAAVALVAPIGMAVAAFAHGMNGPRQIMVDHIHSRRARMMFGWLIFLAWAVITFIGGFANVGAAHQHLAALN